MFFVLKINVVVDNYCLLTKRLTLELSLRKLANWPKSLQEFIGVGYSTSTSLVTLTIN